MKKLAIGEPIKQVRSKGIYCNFCGESDKKCFRGRAGVSISYDKELMAVIDDWVYSILGRKIIKGNVKYRWVETKKSILKEHHADICEDCVKQLVRINIKN